MFTPVTHCTTMCKESACRIIRPVISLEHYGGEEFSEKGPNFLNYVQHIFPGVLKNFPKGGFVLPAPPWLQA